MQKNFFKGLRILDHTRYLLGGYTTQFFGDMGAEVIKIESIGGGDFTRLFEPKINGASYYHVAMDRNKKSLTLNLKSEKGREAYLQLLKQADVVVENFRPGVMSRLGIDYEVEKRMKPDIIHCSLSGFGQRDPRSLLGYHDMNIQGLSGFLSLNGEKNSVLHFTDLAAAMVAIQSISAALLQRMTTGEGAFCDVSMFDSFVWWNSLLDTRYSFAGNQISRDTTAYPFLSYYVWETKDHRYLVSGIAEQKFWEEFLTLIGMEDLKPFMQAKPKENPEVFDRMERLFRSRTLQEWVDYIGDRDVCITPVYTKEEAIRYILDSDAEKLQYCDFTRTGKTLQTLIPHSVSSLPISLKDAKEPPALGENNREILEELGYDEKELAEMERNGDCGPLK